MGFYVATKMKFVMKIISEMEFVVEILNEKKSSMDVCE